MFSGYKSDNQQGLFFSRYKNTLFYTIRVFTSSILLYLVIVIVLTRRLYKKKHIGNTNTTQSNAIHH